MIEDPTSSDLFQYFLQVGVDISLTSKLDAMKCYEPTIFTAYNFQKKNEENFNYLLKKMNEERGLIVQIFPTISSNLNMLNFNFDKESSRDIYIRPFERYILELPKQTSKEDINKMDFYHCFSYREIASDSQDEVLWHFNCFIYWEELENSEESRTKIVIAKAMILITFEPCYSLCYNIMTNLIKLMKENKIKIHYESLFRYLFSNIKISNNATNYITINSLVNKYCLPKVPYMHLCDINLNFFFTLFTLDEFFILLEKIICRKDIIFVSNDVTILYPLFYSIFILSSPFETNEKDYYFHLLSTLNSNLIKKYFGTSAFILGYIYTNIEDFNDIADKILKRNEITIYHIRKTTENNKEVYKTKILYKKKIAKFLNDSELHKTETIATDKIQNSNFYQKLYIQKDPEKYKYYYQKFKTFYDNIQKNKESISKSFFIYDSNINKDFFEFREAFLEFQINFLFLIKPAISDGFALEKTKILKYGYGKDFYEETTVYQEVLNCIFMNLRPHVTSSLKNLIYISQLIFINKQFDFIKFPFEKLSLIKTNINNIEINIDFSFIKNKKFLKNKNGLLPNNTELNNNYEEKKITKFNLLFNRAKSVIYEEVCYSYFLYKLNVLQFKTSNNKIDEITIAKLLCIFVKGYFAMNKKIYSTSFANNTIELCENIFYLIKESNCFDNKCSFVLSIFSFLIFSNVELKKIFCEQLFNYCLNSKIKVSYLASKFKKDLEEEKSKNKYEINCIQSDIVSLCLFDKNGHYHYNGLEVNSDYENFKFKCYICSEDLKLKLYYKNGDEIVVDKCEKPSAIFNRLIPAFLEKKYNAIGEDYNFDESNALEYKEWKEDYRMILFYEKYIIKSLKI